MEAPTDASSANGNSDNHASTAKGSALEALADALQRVVNDPKAIKQLGESPPTGPVASIIPSLSQLCAQLHTQYPSITWPLPSIPSQAGPLVPPFANQTVRASKKSDSDLPDLPPISDPTLAERPFTHQGSLHSERSGRADLSYERLEFLGDAYIECMSTRTIYERYPQLPVGKLSSIREALVNNANLASYAKAYGFDGRIKLPPDVVSGTNKVAAWTKIYADAFEAYVAAVILDSPATGFATAEAWLNELWLAKLRDYDAVPALNSDAKAMLARTVLSRAIRLDYVDEQPQRPPHPPTVRGKRSTQEFRVGVYLTGWGYKGQHLGSGTGVNKAEAGLKAAMQALANKPLIDVIAARKQAFDAEKKAQMELDTSRSQPMTIPP